MRNIPYFKFAFSLAETLITLTIIGVVAAMTIPTLLQKYTDYETVIKVKKMDNIIKNSLKLSEYEKGNIKEYIADSIAEGKTGSQAVMEYLTTGLKVEKNCGVSATKCRPSRWAACNNKKFLDDRNANDRCVKLENGMILCVNREAEPKSTCNNQWETKVCARVHIDINGMRGPNQYSRDDFWWVLTSDGNFRAMMTHGKNYVGCSGGRGGDDASRNGAVKWVLEKGNLDYLYKTVSW